MENKWKLDYRNLARASSFSYRKPRESQSNDQELVDALLLDKEWERIQVKTFTAWANSFLRRRSVQIEDVRSDLRDGKNLAFLLEAISGESLPPLERGRLRLHQITNVSKSLRFIHDKGVKLVGIGPEEIVDGNDKMTLGMIWTIILRFAIQGIEEGMSAKDGLLLWCQRKTKHYKNVSVKNFTNSWQDGLAFCALIHRHRPDLIDYDKLNAADPKKNLELAFNVALKELDIPRMIEPDDVIKYGDEKSIMTYISAFYDLFSKSHELESAVKRLEKALGQQAEYEKHREEYETLASDLLDWIKKTKNEMEDRNVNDDTTEGFSNLLNDLNNYNSNIKPKWANEKQHIQAALNTLQTLLRVNHHPPYIPPEGLNMGNINDLWKNLGDEEKKRLEWIKMNLKRHRSIDHLVRKFKYKCSIAEQFLDGNSSVVGMDVKETELATILARQRKHEALISELNSRLKRLSNIEDVYNQLKHLEYSKIDECTVRYDNIKQRMHTFKSECDEITKTINERVEFAKKLDSLRLDYCREASNFKNLCDSFLEDADDAYIAESVQDVKNLQSEHTKTINNYTEAKAVLDKASDIDHEIKQITEAPNPYISITVEQMTNDYDKLIKLADTKSQSLTKDLKIQENNQEINQRLLQLADTILKWQTEEKAKISTLSGSLESQQDHLKNIEIEVHAYHEPKLHSLKKIVDEINENNTGADQAPLNNVENGYHELCSILKSAKNVIENQILIRDSSTLTEEQLSEIRLLFNKLDKYKLNYLNYDDFRNFLIAMDFKVTKEDTEGENEFKNILAKCDHAHTGHVTLSSFLNYMAESTETKGSAEDMIESFKVLAEGKPYITADKLKMELPNHADRCIASMKPYTGSDAPAGALDYTTYSANLFSGSDL